MTQRHSAALGRICVIGLGNVLLGDDGFGPLVVERFRCEYNYDATVEVLDLGTPGLDLAPYLHGKELVLIADAVHSNDTPGTLCFYSQTALLDRKALLHLTAHDPGVGQCLAQLKLAGHAPSEVFILGVVPESVALGSGISASVSAAVPAAVQSIATLLCDYGAPCKRRIVQEKPNLWWRSSLPGGTCRGDFMIKQGIDHKIAQDQRQFLFWIAREMQG